MLFAHSALAASLYLSPATGSYATGRTFTLGVYVSSPDEAMNSAQGTLIFPTNKLAVVSLSKASSVMNLWVQDPSFSNQDGTVNFGAVIVNPGYQGSHGNILNITFHVIGSGTASISFSSGAVLANDGKGTNILSSLGTAKFAIAPASRRMLQNVPVANTTSPNPFTIYELTSDLTDPRPIFAWRTDDAKSGIVKYLVRIGNGDWFNAATIATTTAPGIYQLPFQAPAKNVLLAVDASDGAGNITEATTSFTIAPIPAPIIAKYTDILPSPDQPFSAEGVAPQNTVVDVYFTNSGVTLKYSTPVDNKGHWVLVKKINSSPGIWQIAVQAVDARGVLSPAAVAPVIVKGSGDWITNVLQFFLAWSSIVITGLSFAAIIIGVEVFMVHRYKVRDLASKRGMVKLRKEFHDDLKRIEKELEADQMKSKIDLSASGLHKKRELVRKEIEHLEEDLKKGIK